MDIAARLAAFEILAPSSGRVLTRLAAAVVDLSAGETSNALESGGMVVFVETGKLRISSISGTRIGFADIDDGGIYGLAEAVSGAALPPCAVLALDQTKALAVPGDALSAAIRSNTACAIAVAERFARALIANSAGTDPLQKIYRDILRAARPVGDARWTVDPLPRHKELAANAGVDESVAASAVAHLIRIGVARRRYPALDIEDREALRALAG